MLTGVLFVGLLGTAAELVLIEHYEDRNQLVPLIALGLGLAALGWDTAAQGRASRRALRLAMLGLVASSVAGMVLHYRSNEEFQRELDPALTGRQLVLATLRSQSPPSLAPGMLGLLGALGWIATHGRTDADGSRQETNR